MTAVQTPAGSCHTGDLVQHHRLHRLVNEITLPEGFRVVIGNDPVSDGGTFFLQIAAWRRDVVTGEMGEGKGGKARPSKHACDSEIVGATFGLYKSYVEHEARETFEFRGRRIFGPHIDVFALWDAAEHLADSETPDPTADIDALIADLSLADGFRIVSRYEEHDMVCLAIGGPRYDPTTGFRSEGFGDDLYLPHDASPTRVLDAIFNLYRTFVEDEARRTFLFRNRAIYDARIDVHALWAESTRIDSRPARQAGVA